jgi:type II secretory pathway component PulK
MKTPFRKVEDLLAVPGISKARLEKLRPYIKISASPPTKKPSKPPTP